MMFCGIQAAANFVKFC